MPSVDEHESSRPPPPPPPPLPSAKPRDNGWRPAEDDDGPRAVAWRARRAVTVAREVRAEQEELRAAIGSLAVNVGALTGAVDGVKRLAAWALGIVGSLAVAGLAIKIWVWISTLPH